MGNKHVLVKFPDNTVLHSHYVSSVDLLCTGLTEDADNYKNIPYSPGCHCENGLEDVSVYVTWGSFYIKSRACRHCKYLYPSTETIEDNWAEILCLGCMTAKSPCGDHTHCWCEGESIPACLMKQYENPNIYGKGEKQDENL